MSKLINDLEQYLSEIAQQHIPIQDAPEVRQSLPIFLGGQYRFYHCRLFQKDRILFVWDGQGHPKIQNIVNQMDHAVSAIGQGIIFVIPGMLAFQRQRLIQHQIPFIVPGRQIYLPEAIIDIRTLPTGSAIEERGASEVLSSPAQVMLLYHLLHGSDRDWHLGGWARELGYSDMTISRAFRELVGLELCKSERRDRRIIPHFPYNRRSLWRRAQKYLQNPVRKRMTAQLVNTHHVPLYQSGYGALAEFSQLAEASGREYALSGADLMQAIKRSAIREQHFSEDEVISIEKWKYPPGVLARNSQTVDQLSLYLSLQHDPDERVQIALDEMIAGREW